MEDEEGNYEIEDMDDFIENDNNNNSNESHNNNNIHEEDSIIDAPMDIDQMPNINEGAPYFETSTSALLFCWMQKHNICKFHFIIITNLNLKFKSNIS